MEKVIRLFSTRPVSLFIRVAVPAALLYIVFQMVSLDHLLRALSAANLTLIFAGLLLVVPAFTVRIHSWHVLLTSGGENIGWRQSAASFLVGQSFGFMTPGGLGDFLVRGTSVPSIATKTVIGLTILDNALLFLFVAATGISALVIMFIATPMKWILVALTVAALFFSYFNIDAVLERTIRLAHRVPYVREIVNRLTDIPRASRRVLLETFVLLGFFLCIEYVQVYVILSAFCEPPFIDVVISYAAILFIKFAVPFAAGDLGVRELSSVYLFSLNGIPESAALNASLIHFLSNNVLPALIGGWIFMHAKSAHTSAQAVQQQALEPANK